MSNRDEGSAHRRALKDLLKVVTLCSTPLAWRETDGTVQLVITLQVPPQRRLPP